MGFRNEKQLRKLVRDCSKKALWWIEPNYGATEGLPDVFTVDEAMNGRMVFLELKKGELVNGSVLVFEVRRAQRDELPRMTACGALGAIAVAQIGTPIVHILSLEPDTLRGRVDLGQMNAAKDCFEVRKGSIIGEEVVWKCWGIEARKALGKMGIGV